MEVSTLPIDIHYNKLLDWLIDRRHCDLRWHQQLQDVKRKINTALSSLPNKEKEPLISRVLAIEDVTYCDCTDVMEYLLTIESQDKNFIGQYTSALLKEWDDILKSYEKKNLHLAEGGQLMCRLVNYEIASLKRQITKCQQSQKECSRKANDSQISTRSLQAKFEEQCQELGIEGKDVHSELTQLLSTQLPVLFDEVVSLASHLEGALNYYQIFRNCTLSNVSDYEVLKLLKYFVKHGNVTVYQWENGSPPPELITTSMDKVCEVSSDEPTEVNEATIDWGDLGGGEERGEGEEERGEKEGEGGIDFGDEGGDIDFDISIDLTGITLEEDGINTVSGGNDNKSFLTLLEDIDTRNLLMDQLSELFEFIKQRMTELSSTADTSNTTTTATNSSVGSLLLQVDLPSSVQAYSSDDVMAMLSNVRLVIDKMTSKRTQQLLLMLGSQSYLDRLSSQLLRQQELSQRARWLVTQHTQRIKEVGEEQLKHEQGLDLLVKETKRIKSMVSKEISKKYNNRTVNIVGEINQL